MFIVCMRRFRNIAEVQDNGKHFYWEEKVFVLLSDF